VEQTAMKKFLTIVLFCLPAFGQGEYSGLGQYAGPAAFGGSSGAPTFFAALPVNWVDNTICNPPSGVYDTTILIGTSINNGPNITGGGTVGTSPYALTYQGLLDAMNNWRDNADNASQTPHFADKWWLIQVPAGTVLHGSTFDANDALISIPGKVNGTSEPAKCMVIDSTTPLPAGQMACGRGLPGFGGARNPGCTSPNDKSSMWKVQLDGPLVGVGKIAVYAGSDLVTPTNWTSHVVLRDVEITMAPGAAQSAVSVQAARFFVSDDGQGSFPPKAWPTHIGLDRYYIHGWDPGDPGQPTTGSSVDAAGNCKAWDNAGTVNTVNATGTTGTVTWASGAYFGMTFTVGSTITIGGVAYTIAAFDPSASNTVLTISGQPGVQSAAAYTEANPPSQYTPGCGDDTQVAVAFNCDWCWRQNGYIEKIHWWGSESHSSSQGFDNGPYKDVNNWEEGGSAAWFSGGGPVDTQGGPGSDNEIRRNYLGRDLNYRQLSAAAGNSPSPPWGCGTFDGNAAHNTCPFSWAIKNSMEQKLGHRNLIDGNIIENSWSDSQSGFCVLVNVRVCSGGSTCGIYDPVTGLPKTYIDNIRFSNNWIRNCPQPIQMANRSEGPGDGGGVSLPVQDNDFINNLITNVGDTNQFGSPGDQWEWTSGSNIYHCVMSRASNVATATCVPYQSDFSSKVVSISSVSNVVTVVEAERSDPILCLGSATTCIANGQTAILSNHAGWNGIFAMTGTSGNWAADGTGGSNIIYTDTTNSPGTATLCDNNGSPTCTALLGAGDFTIASLGFKMTDIVPGDDVYTYNTCSGTGCVGGGDVTCATNGYAVGSTSATYAIAGTVTTGLIIKYPNNGLDDSSGATQCMTNNGAGFPKYTTIQNNTILAPNLSAITAYNTWWQPISNLFWNNVFATNDPSNVSDVYCSNNGGGTVAFACWDNNTFEFYLNVLTGRNPSAWSVVNCPGANCANSFPTTVNCSGSTATAGCLGYTGFMGPTPAVTYPTGSCANGNAPFNCPLMALPWANNLTLSDLSYVGTSSYSTQGVDTTKVNTAMTQTEYVCPTGATCGTHGPYPDN
jgi:hypothetical protein